MRNPLDEIEKALLVGVEFPGERLNLPELARLAETAGAVVVGTLTQNRPSPDPKFFIGTGKMDELVTQVNLTGATLVIFDHQLKASQERNIEKVLKVKVIDRTELILDIFAQHAKTREGKLQVDLAQSEFLMTRLTGHGASMSRLGGGIATRGPGETKLEYDRRELRSKVAELKKQLEKVRQEREIKRERRQETRIRSAVIVGYTNAGKSTLLNSLTKAGVLTQDKLFATLDPTTRRLYLPSGQTIIITDTVGFIEKLPHSLIASFHATLEEVTKADLLVHVVDAANPDLEGQMNAVYGVLEELQSITKPIVTVFNKADKLEKKLPSALLKKYKPSISISALNKEGLDKFLVLVDEQIGKLM